MLKKAAIVAGAAASLLALAPVANADTAAIDGVNPLNDNNVSVAPIQACGNDIAVAGAVVEIVNFERTNCVNAPIVDHPFAKS